MADAGSLQKFWKFVLKINFFSVNLKNWKKVKKDSHRLLVEQKTAWSSQFLGNLLREIHTVRSVAQMSYRAQSLNGKPI